MSADGADAVVEVVGDRDGGGVGATGGSDTTVSDVSDASGGSGATTSSSTEESNQALAGPAAPQRGALKKVRDEPICPLKLH
jgi:hypothetical protein